jgi:hypothetical protein
MLAFVAASVLGAFGHGLFSERTLANPDWSVEIHYEPVVRFGAPTNVILDNLMTERSQVLPASPVGRG